MKQYVVIGMSCAACSNRVEKAVAKVPGVTSVSVSLLTNSMGVEGDAQSQSVIEAVEKAGYHAELKGSRSNESPTCQTNNPDTAWEDKETPKMKGRLLASVGFLLVLMYISMGNMMWGWKLPDVIERNPMTLALIQLLLTTIIMIINQRFFVRGFQGLLHRAPNMDTLVALGAGAAYVYSLYAVFGMSEALYQGNMEQVHRFMHELYFESAATILTLITVGKTLEAHSKGKTTDALKSLVSLAPKTAVLLVDGEEKEVPVEEVKKGDCFVIRPGESVPVDGFIVKGMSSVNEAALTGESVPVDKKEGDPVAAATLNQDGYLVCRADRVGEDTTLSQIIQMVSDAAATKAPIAKVADTVSGIFVPVVMGIAFITILIWIFAGQSFGYALARGISVLVISCPCALGLATPVAIMVGNGIGAKNGILFKTAVSLETTGKARIAVLDKTGTITMGEPKVTDVVPYANVVKEHLLQAAYSLESKSEHPLAKAIMEYGDSHYVPLSETEEFQAVSGNGLQGRIEGKMVYGGKKEFIETKAHIPEEIQNRGEVLADQGKTPLYFAREGQFLGCIAVADIIKEDSPRAIAEMKNMGIRVVMLTGDNQKTAEAIGRQVGVDEMIAGVLPGEKEEHVRRFAGDGTVIMVGDGINDAPALTRADIGIAIGAGTDVAVDAADVVLMKSNLSDVAAAIRLSRCVLRNIHQNLFWAFIYNTIGIPLAAGVWIPLFGWQLNPMFGAAAMGLSSFCVVSNALRLNLLDIHSTRGDRKRYWKERKTSDANASDLYKKEKETKEMTKTVKIEGMMCGHCEARVKKTLEALAGVTAAEVSHEKGTAVVTLSEELADDIIKEAVEAQDYKVTEIL